ncbi:MAG: tRNA glutamyl-Q(34) synthetase GluQRS [Magnetococcales bacterium]|nr:tRNA glutamyl-Q(34) synthetase GluQRS [Magnetococcales bacterium]
MVISRFAPSPTGFLHLGHAYSALTAYATTQEGGRFLLRLEDIDGGRCRESFVQAIFEDLHWLGLRWPKPVRRQSEQMTDYAHALDILTDKGVLYPCFCTRSEMAAERARLGQVQRGPDGPLYPGSCRQLTPRQKEAFLHQQKPFALRLDMEQAVARVGRLSWFDRLQGEVVATPERFGDVVLARKETPTSYHLSVTVDDHLQEINQVVRGQDLFQATHIHRLLQALLGLNTPQYHHHRLLLDTSGQKLAKSNRSLSIRSLRQQGVTPEEVRQQINLSR